MSPPLESGCSCDYLGQYCMVEVTLCDFTGFVLAAGTHTRGP